VIFPVTLTKLGRPEPPQPTNAINSNETPVARIVKCIRLSYKEIQSKECEKMWSVDVLEFAERVSIVEIEEILIHEISEICAKYWI